MTSKEENEIKKLNKHLKEVRDKFKQLKECGMDEEILIIYLQRKTGLSMKKIKEMLDNLEQFYEKLVVEDSIKKL